MAKEITQLLYWVYIIIIKGLLCIKQGKCKDE